MNNYNEIAVEHTVDIDPFSKLASLVYAACESGSSETIGSRTKVASANKDTVEDGVLSTYADGFIHSVVGDSYTVPMKVASAQLGEAVMLDVLSGVAGSL